MGLFLRQDENRSELQSKIIADLQEKVRSKASLEGDKEYEPTLLENQHETRTAGVVIGLLLISLALVIVFVVVRSR